MSFMCPVNPRKKQHRLMFAHDVNPLDFTCMLYNNKNVSENYRYIKTKSKYNNTEDL